MRRGGLKIVCLPILLLLLAPTLSVAQEDRTVNLESRVLESFDPNDRASDWLVRGSKFVADGFPKKAYAESWPEALYGANREGKELEVLGAHFKFNKQGYNYIEFIPVRENDEGNLVPNPLTIPGRAKQLDLWVWGSDYDYYLEAHLRDHRGMVHTLKLGNLDFVGWKNLRIDIPGYIPQSSDHVPYLEQLSLVKLVLWTKPTEAVRDCYVYFDQIKVLTDVFVDRFDGDALAQPGKVQEIWGESDGQDQNQE